MKKLNAFRIYKKAFDKAIDSIRAFSPDLLHAHILTRVGYIAMKKAAEWNIPYVLSEHWSRYFPENGSYQGWVRKQVTKKVCSNAAALIAVSEELRSAMFAEGLKNRRFVVIPNVVDPGLIYPESGERSEHPVTMVHVSCFDDRSKNISGLLRSLKMLADKGIDFRCVFVGEGPDLQEIMEYAGFLRFGDGMVVFAGLLTGDALARTMAEADFAVLSSRYETFGTVIVEGLAAGLPVVSTRVGIAAEIIDESNGLLVAPGDEMAMAATLEAMIQRCRNYDRQVIRRTLGERFSRSTIGSRIFDIYQEVIAEKKR
jgi:glycosyltransferase involved in cell wall biosynthesis